MDLRGGRNQNLVIEEVKKKFKFVRQIFDADDDGIDSMLLTTIIGMVG